MSHRLLTFGAVFALLLGALVPTTLARSGAGGAGRTVRGTPRTVTADLGSGSATTGDFTGWDTDTGIAAEDEFAGDADSQEDGASGDVYSSNRIDRSLSVGVKVPDAPNTGGTNKAKSHPQFQSGFAGLNHYQQRYSRGGNQFSVEPPDQGLCVGNGYVVEAVNDVMNVFDTSGQSVLPDNTATNIVGSFPRNVNHAVDLNSFYGYAAAVQRPAGPFGPFVTDPSCLYDAATGRFFVVVLTLDTNPANGAFTHANHLDLAVSQTSNPTGAWNIYRIGVTNDGGSNPDARNACPCLGDYPHIGADANGFYITTNAYPWAGNGFNGAQVYAMSKSDLAAGVSSLTVVHFDTWGAVSAPSDAGSTQPGFTVWPAQSPGTGDFDLSNGGTEYFLSSNAADEATHPVAGTGGNYQGNQVVLWTLAGSSNLPSATLSSTVLSSEDYSLPPKQTQPGTGDVASATTTPGAPQGDCLNDETTVTIAGTGCWRLLVGATAHAAGTEHIMQIDSNDTRMQQVSYANGKVWGALDTGAELTNSITRAAIAWFIVNPGTPKVAMQGYLANAGYDFTYPAIGVTSSGRGVMAFTATGGPDHDVNPSAAYAAIDAVFGLTAWNIVPGGQGNSVDDGFSGYKQQRFPNPIRPRWGDYGAAAVDGNSVWLASEFIQATCNYTDWGGPFFQGGTGDNLLGTCGGTSHGPGTRTALANWSTFISKYTP